MTLQWLENYNKLFVLNELPTVLRIVLVGFTLMLNSSIKANASIVPRWWFAGIMPFLRDCSLLFKIFRCSNKCSNSNFRIFGQCIVDLLLFKSSCYKWEYRFSDQFWMLSLQNYFALYISLAMQAFNNWWWRVVVFSFYMITSRLYYNYNWNFLC